MWGTLLALIWYRQPLRASLSRDRQVQSMAISSLISRHSVSIWWYCIISVWAAQLSNSYTALARVSNLSPGDVRRSLNHSDMGLAGGSEQSGSRTSWAMYTGSFPSCPATISTSPIPNLLTNCGMTHSLVLSRTVLDTFPKLGSKPTGISMVPSCPWSWVILRLQEATWVCNCCLQT